jgi:predicted kinase
MKIIMVIGLPGSGKSFFASRLAERIHAEYLSSDSLRKKMFLSGRYAQEDKEKVYRIMLSLLGQAVQNNQNIILDATFYKDNLRKLFFEKAESLNTTLYIIEVVAPFSLIRKRLLEKRKDSEADLQVYEKIKKQFEPVTEAHLQLESQESNFELMISEALNYIHE